MLRSVPHVVCTQRVEVEFENPKHAFECRNQLSEICKNKLLPAIELLFDEKIREDRIVRIEKLQLDAGILEKEGWEKKFVEEIIKQLRLYLDRIPKDKMQPVHRSHVEDFNPSPSEDSAIEINEYTADERFEEAFIYFLKKGVLPWFTLAISYDKMHESAFQLIKSKSTFKRRILTLISNNSLAHERLIFQFRADLLFELFSNEQVNAEKIKQWKRSFDKLFSFTEANKKLLDKAFHRAVEQAIPLVSAKTKQEAILERILKEVLHQLDVVHIDLISKHVDTLTGSPFQEIKVKRLKGILSHYKEQNSSVSTVKSTKKGKQSEKSMDRKIMDQIDDGPVFIENSGLVLLHPFLANLCENIGYTKEQKWESAQLHERGVLLTHYLITGQNEFPEYEMFLNKLMMGYPLDNPLSLEAKLSDFEMNETNDLFVSVIKHWVALKNTSVEGLRNTFLQRAGKLTKKESGWLLQVEQKAFDILLDKIPWGFSTIKTPWMDEILSVEWT